MGKNLLFTICMVSLIFTSSCNYSRKENAYNYEDDNSEIVLLDQTGVIKVVSIEIYNYPKTQYEVGEDFSFDGLKLLLIYSDSSTNIIDGTIDMIAFIPNIKEPGQKEVLLYYEEIIISYEINVVETNKGYYYDFLPPKQNINI